MDRSRAATQAVYDEIAAHFAETRRYPWPEVTEFLDAAPPGEFGLDVGCGNGRHLAPLADRVEHTIGLDLSTELLEIARERTNVDADLVAGDAATLPVRSDSIAVAVSIATLHHLPTRDLRVRSLDEIARVLTPDGQALVSAWSVAADRFDADAGFDAEIPWELPDGETVDRYYHVYDPDEFEADLAASDVRVLDVEVSSGNCYATVAKPE
ncbi:methyltransferase type 11 [Salinarchaeum sp. Harcht-Bsk1]|uniref:class I SAM-dependent methyltransferase n=1 Tax=Salinarchaeum sp. Harcht-Bsk1 TaxID=1333523 RepID=UPI00034228D8|nr:class I SAM-dependent methyltransferase [Salinarchaeum sp. Harcht-Bsk1]AGN01494.1 methyltransferase type 11 [Salinarchaeum sp. Harcht-Bsk1]